MKNVLLTGASGFLGQHILNAINQKFNCYTLGRKKLPTDKHFQTAIPFLTEFEFPIPFDIVIHTAGKAHSIPKTEAEKEAFFTVNTLGTASLLQKLNTQKPELFIFISSVAVYGVKKGEQLSENQALLAQDPYGKSKIEAEKLVSAWGEQNKVKIIILRLPLVYGENLTGNLKSMQTALEKGYYFQLNKGKALRSVVHAHDVANLFLNPEKIATGIYNLTSKYDPDFAEIAAFLVQKYHTKTVKNLPLFLAFPLASIGSFLGYIIKREFPFNFRKMKIMSENLTFSSEKAKKEFGWNPNTWKKE